MTEPRPTSKRSKGRKRALDILFEADLRGLDPAIVLADRIAAGEPPVRPFTVELVEGVREHILDLDAALAASLTGTWTLDRMPRVDRNLARIALFELTHTDTPGEIVVSQAVDLARELSTAESPGYLNGVLGAALRARAHAEPQTPPGQ